ncbi:MAG: hypothetical protein ACI9JD_004846, partial [Rhodococcus sp. (in: high G+C Gram-positive bacteria)]
NSTSKKCVGNHSDGRMNNHRRKILTPHTNQPNPKGRLIIRGCEVPKNIWH